MTFFRHFACIVSGFIISMLVMYSTVHFHEGAHAQYLRYLGYNNVTTMVSWTGEGKTIYNGRVSEEDDKLVYLADAMNEAVGYNTLLPLSIISGILAMIYMEQITRGGDDGRLKGLPVLRRE